MEAKPDAGDIVGQVAVDIGPDETATDVFSKVSGAAVEVIQLPYQNYSMAMFLANQMCWIRAVILVVASLPMGKFIGIKLRSKCITSSEQ